MLPKTGEKKEQSIVKHPTAALSGEVIDRILWIKVSEYKCNYISRVGPIKGHY